jgi:ketosteroid isomerase-like protein
MRRLAVALIGLTLVCLCAETSSAKDAAVRKAISAEYAKFSRAAKKKDVKTALSIGTADLVVVQPDGQTMNRQQIEAMLSLQMNMVKQIRRVDIAIASLSVRGKQAVALVSMTLSGVVEDSEGKQREVISQNMSRDTWVKTDKGWRMKRSESVNSAPDKRRPGSSRE